jgi:lipopolysaccharide transport system ATP-binding protein
MQMRVTFSVATAFRPDLLIVDEALSVGDSYFQHKSFDRIREFRNHGCSLLIVSHDRSAVQALCDRAILLEKGSMIKDGDPEEVMDFYNALIAEKENQKVEILQHISGKVQTISGTGEATLASIQLLNSEKKAIEFVDVGESVELVVRVQVNADIPQLVLGYIIKDRLGQSVFGTNTWHTNQVFMAVKAGSTIEYRVTFAMNLGPGSYSIAIALHSHDVHVTNNYEWRDLACVFNVVNLNKIEFIGSTWLAPKIEVYQ